MVIYLINIILILAWNVLLKKYDEKAHRKYFCIIAAVQWTLLSGLRALSVGADTYAYYVNFEDMKLYPWDETLELVYDYLFKGEEIKDPGYYVVMKAFQLFSGSYQMFLLAIAVLFMSLMGRWIYKYSASPVTSFILFSTLFYSFYAVTGHRQTIATALIFFQGYEYIKERKLIRFAIISFIAFLIHKSCVVFVPFYFLAFVPYRRLTVTIYLVLACIVVVLGKQLYGPIALALGFDQGQVDYAVGGADLYAVMLTLLSLVTLFFMPQIKERREDINQLFNATAITLVTALLVIQNQGFMRIQQYYSMFMMITIPEVIETVEKKSRMLTYLLFGAVMVLYMIRNNPHYAFFFSFG